MTGISVRVGPVQSDGTDLWSAIFDLIRVPDCGPNIRGPVRIRSESGQNILLSDTKTTRR